MKKIFRKYQSLGTVYGSELLLDHQQALRFITDCAQANLVILGMDFYTKEDGVITPLVASADYSSLSETPDAVARSTQAAQKLTKDGFPDGASYVSFVVDTPREVRQMTPRMGPDRDEVDWWIELSLREIAKEQKNIEAGERDQGIYTSMYLDYMSLGRARYLHGTHFLYRDTVKEARAAFQKAAECMEMSFRMAYDPTLPEYLGDQADWG